MGMLVKLCWMKMQEGKFFWAFFFFMYNLDRRRAKVINDKSKNVDDTGKNCFSKGFKTEGEKKKVCWFMLFPILAPVIVSGMNSYSASFRLPLSSFSQE